MWEIDGHIEGHSVDKPEEFGWGVDEVRWGNGYSSVKLRPGVMKELGLDSGDGDQEGSEAW